MAVAGGGNGGGHTLLPEGAGSLDSSWAGAVPPGGPAGAAEGRGGLLGSSTVVPDGPWGEPGSLSDPLPYPPSSSMTKGC